MALSRDLLLAFLEPQYKLNKEDPSFLIPEILLTDKLKRDRQGDRSRSGLSFSLGLPDTGDVEGICRTTSQVCSRRVGKIDIWLPGWG